jgi:hypothetical protein
MEAVAITALVWVFLLLQACALCAMSARGDRR